VVVLPELTTVWVIVKVGSLSLELAVTTLELRVVVPETRDPEATFETIEEDSDKVPVADNEAEEL
jgi:hypothetical protein